MRIWEDVEFKSPMLEATWLHALPQPFIGLGVETAAAQVGPTTLRMTATSPSIH